MIQIAHERMIWPLKLCNLEHMFLRDLPFQIEIVFHIKISDIYRMSISGWMDAHSPFDRKPFSSVLIKGLFMLRNSDVDDCT